MGKLYSARGPRLDRQGIHGMVRTTATAVLTCISGVVFAAGDLPTEFSNSGSIVNTRHNLTQSSIPSGGNTMDPYRNDYNEVCVYCHTPHGASGTVDAPLWNRTTAPAGGYTLFAPTTTLQGTPTNPGDNSRTCLSCHDGTIGVDSIINMPGSGNYSAAQETVQNNAFLNSWDPANNGGGSTGADHYGLGDPNAGTLDDRGCLACHASNGFGSNATDFTVFRIGTDLTDDHPIGIEFPAVGDFTTGTVTVGSLTFFDNNGNSRADKDEVRFYNSGDGPEVECASCHDPHGVPSAGTGSVFKPTFLRVDNSQGSALCLTCHVK